MPEQGKAEQAAPDGGAESLEFDLRHHYGQPDQPGGDVQAVAADESEERGEKSAALRSRAARDHVGELMHLKIEECGSEQESDQSKEVGVKSSPRADRQRHHPARVARDEKTSGLDRDVELIEQLVAGWTARSRTHQRRISG